MTPVILLLAAAQAGLLLWAAVHLSDAFLRPRKRGSLLWALAALATALALTGATADEDHLRILCSTGDCLVLALSVALVRVLAVNREEGRLAHAYADDLRRAAEAAEAEREVRKAEQVSAAVATLETHLAAAKNDSARPSLPPRHTTPSLLSGGAPSPRLPTTPRK